MPGTAALLRAYVQRHNEGVRSGRFSGLRALLADDAALRFHGIAAGPFEGASGILAAFAAQPPDDELLILDLRGAEATYAWGRDPARPAGRIRITAARGRITAIDVTAGSA
jgi:hypothetical protein